MLPFRRAFRRVLRWAWNGLAVLSLLLFVGAVAMWVRSYVVEDYITCRRADGTRWLSAAPGRLVLGWDLADWGDRSYRLQYTRSPPDSTDYDLMLRMLSLRVGPGDTYVIREWGGFAWANWQAAGKGAAIGRCVLPFWPVAAAAALLPLGRLILSVHSRARRRRLSRSGLCPACAYDLTGNESGVCPECGKPLAPAGVKGGG